LPFARINVIKNRVPVIYPVYVQQAACYPEEFVMHAEEHSLFFISGKVEGRVVFSDEECHHMVSVLRAQPDAIIRATDGKGHIYRCSLSSFDKKNREAHIVEILEQPLAMPRIHAYIGMPEREHFEDALTNLTALGIAEITPVTCRFCQQKWWSAWNKYEERFNKKMAAAIKQSMNAWMPKLNAPLSFADVAASAAASSLIVADGSGKQCCDVPERFLSGNEIGCMVGPPGGLAPDELALLASLGAEFVTLGRTRLRTELAAVVLSSTLLQLSSRGR
jgi:16S rRNA (uracil1498-N3)-methyltransferase